MHAQDIVSINHSKPPKICDHERALRITDLHLQSRTMRERQCFYNNTPWNNVSLVELMGEKKTQKKKEKKKKQKKYRVCFCLFFACPDLAHSRIRCPRWFSVMCVCFFPLLFRHAT